MGREGKFPNSVDNLVTKNNVALKGEEETHTVDTMLLKEGLEKVVPRQPI